MTQYVSVKEYGIFILILFKVWNLFSKYKTLQTFCMNFENIQNGVGKLSSIDNSGIIFFKLHFVDFNTVHGSHSYVQKKNSMLIRVKEKKIYFSTTKTVRLIL